METSVESKSGPESEALSATPLYFPVDDKRNACQSLANLPLLESKKSTPTAQDIESKLRETKFRRRPFFELLSRKARPKLWSPAQSSPHLEGSGKQQKRACQLRVAAKKKRMPQLLRKRLIQKSRHKKCVWAAIRYKRTSAENKRLEFLEAEKSMLGARGLLVKPVLKAVNSRHKIERRKLKSKLENQHQMAKRLRTEYSMKMANSHCSDRASHKVDHGDLLSRKLTRCWRKFTQEKGTTVSLAKAYTSLGINEKSVKLMPFEQLAPHLESSATIQAAKALLDRFESRITIRQKIVGGNKLFMLQNIDHLLKHVSSLPGKRVNRGANRLGSRDTLPYKVKLSRYPVRVFLCAYMILGHPDAVFNGEGGCESTLAESAKTFIKEFELLIKIILEGPISCSTEGNVSPIQLPHSFKSQLESFDKAWCSYLYCFVRWKVEDAKLLEEDLVRAACELEVKRIEIQKQSLNKDWVNFDPGMNAFQEKVTENQKLLQAYLQHLSGKAGVEHMERALSDIRLQFIDTKAEAERSLESAGENFSARSSTHISQGAEINGDREDQRMVYKQTADDLSTSSNLGSVTPRKADICLDKGSMSVTENEVLVNEIVHEHINGLVDGLCINAEKEEKIKAMVRCTMEKAFWDAVLETIKQDEPDYSWVLKLLREVRDELCEISPSSWRQEITETCDIDILSQVLNSGTLDMDYLGRILKFAMDILLKLCAPAKENELKNVYEKFQEELNGICETRESTNASFALVVIKGLHFILQQIQSLKQDISKARIRLLESLVKGPAGLDYLRNAFTNRYGAPTEAPVSLPLVQQWLSEVIQDSEQEWTDHLSSLSNLSSQGIPPSTLRAGGSIVKVATAVASAINAGAEISECGGEKVDLYLRLGLLKLVSGVHVLTIEKLPETLKLNFSRLIDIQSKLQKIRVICTSALVMRQTLLSDQVVISHAEMENKISKCVEHLLELLDKREDAGISEIIEAMKCSNDDDMNSWQSKKAVMENMLMKSLRVEDIVFAHISRTLYLAARGIVLGGSGVKGRQLAEMVLKRIGAAPLTRKLIEAMEKLVIMANVSASVHRAWYEEVLKNM